MSPEPMLKETWQRKTHAERVSLHNGMLKNGLTDRLSFYQERLDVLGKFDLYLN